ncbi:MAG TPA: CPBP family intramembrane glutamic endopeptidase [Candidatus Lokiarchaeia archaeon]|nr:CPBP family intramembrane glutamic endopeptidase [Candidatus Lokiarchaeia archaeon]
MGEDLFDRENIDQEDKEESEIRKEVTFDIEQASESDKKAAFNVFKTVYGKHFSLLFVASIIAVIVLFTGFALYASLSWLSNPVPRTISLAAGFLATPVALTLVMPVVERNAYKKDAWSLERLGFQSLASASSRKSLLMALFPLILLGVMAIFPLFSLSSSFSSPFYILFVIGGIPAIIFEELLFRGVYWKYLEIRYNKFMNLALINAGVFAAIHIPRLIIQYVDGLLLGNLIGTIFSILIILLSYFLAGFVLALLRDIFKNILAPIAFHLVYDILVFVLFIDNVMMSFTWLLLLCGIVIFFVFARMFNVFKIPAGIQLENIPAELKKPVLESRMHNNFRLVFFLGNGLVLYYYGAMMSQFDSTFFIITSIVIVAAWVIFGIFYVKKRWLFKLE